MGGIYDQNYHISMKKILFRKLLFDCLIFFFITLMSISVIIWVFQAVNFLDIMIEDGRNYLVYLGYTFSNFPKIISRIVPFALFFSFSYIFIKYEMNNELIIFWNFGVSKLTLVNFFFKFSLIATIFQIILLSFVVPKSQDLGRSLLRKSEVDYFEGLIKPKKFNDTIKGLTIYAEEKDLDGVLKNIYIKNISPNQKFQITFAKKGIFEMKSDKKVLVLYDGQTINGNNENLTNFSFSKSDFGLTDMTSHTITHTKVQEQSTKDLINCLKILKIKNNFQIKNCEVTNLKNIYKELFKRLVKPIYLPSLILISLLLILNSKENIRYNKYRLIIFISGILTIVLSESSVGYLQENLLINLQLVSIPIILIIFLYIIFLYQCIERKKFNL